MMPLCSVGERSVYASGRIACGDERVFRPGGLALTARAVALAGLDPGAAVLDLGCGAGQSVVYLRKLGINAIGVDCEGDRNLLHGLDCCEHIVASADNLPFADGSVDGILAECSLSVMEDQDRVVAECSRVLTDGGSMMITDLYARNPEEIARVRILKGSSVAGMIARVELEARLTAHGFIVNVWEDHSQALRECAARFILDHYSLEGLWQCSGVDSAETIRSAMKSARAGYFLAVATLHRPTPQKGE